MGFTIKELETLSGIKAHTIRIWEQRYGFLKPNRTTTNIRTYNNEELKTILTVALLNKYGYKISRIDGMQPEQRNKEVLHLPAEEAKTEHLINELIGCMIDMEPEEFEKILNAHIEQNGIYNTITTVIFQFLEKTGILWQTGRINPAHEHIVSNITRQKIITAIEALPPATKKSPRVLLLLPEYEYHELGLLFVYYLLKQKGHSTIYLGANVPLKDALYVAQLKGMDFVYMHLTSIPSRLNLHKYIVGLTANTPTYKVVVSGGVTQQLKKLSSSEALLPLQSLPQVLSYISSL